MHPFQARRNNAKAVTKEEGRMEGREDGRKEGRMEGRKEELQRRSEVAEFSLDRFR